MLLPIARSVVVLVASVAHSSGFVLGPGRSLVRFMLLLHFAGGFFLATLLLGFHALVNIHQGRKNEAVGEHLNGLSRKNIFCEKHLLHRNASNSSSHQCYLQRLRVLPVPWSKREKKSKREEVRHASGRARRIFDGSKIRNHALTSLPQRMKLRRVKIMIVVLLWLC